MLIFFIITISTIVGLNSLVKKAVDDYQYGGGSFQEWQDFEATHKSNR